MAMPFLLLTIEAITGLSFSKSITVVEVSSASITELTVVLPGILNPILLIPAKIVTAITIIPDAIIIFIVFLFIGYHLLYLLTLV